MSTEQMRLRLVDPVPSRRFPDNADDLLTVALAALEKQTDVADRMSRLLNGDAGRTLEEMADILDEPMLRIVYAFAILSQAGALFKVLEFDNGERGYVLVGWVE